VNSAEHRGWPHNLKRDPRAAINIFDMENPYRKLSIVAHVVVMATDGAVEHINKLAHKYRGTDYRGDMDRVIIKFAIDKVDAYGF